MIKVAFFDFNGTLDDGKITVDSNGVSRATFCNYDLAGVKELQKTGVKVIVLSTNPDELVKVCCEKFKLDGCHTGNQNKKKFIEEYAKENGLSLKEISMIGNDVNDMEALNLQLGYSVYIDERFNGVFTKDMMHINRVEKKFAVRNFCEYIMKVNDGE